jgi:hypothetical protein
MHKPAFANWQRREPQTLSPGLELEARISKFPFSMFYPFFSALKGTFVVLIFSISHLTFLWNTARLLKLH